VKSYARSLESGPPPSHFLVVGNGFERCIRSLRFSVSCLSRFLDRRFGLTPSRRRLAETKQLSIFTANLLVTYVIVDRRISGTGLEWCAPVRSVRNQVDFHKTVSSSPKISRWHFGNPRTVSVDAKTIAPLYARANGNLTYQCIGRSAMPRNLAAMDAEASQ